MKYIGVVCLVILMVFGMLGVAYSEYDQRMAVGGNFSTGIWNAVDYTDVNVAGAPDCTVHSLSTRTFTIKVHFKDNSRHDYNGSIVCPLLNDGTVSEVIDSILITKTGPERDPSASNLIVTPTGALAGLDNAPIGSKCLEPAGLTLSGNPSKDDYYVTVTFTTRIFTK
jgi:hypothetical protein